MTPMISTIEIARPPEAVFSYVTDPSRMPEWQQGVTSGRLEGVGVGSRCITTRRMGGGTREVVTEITEYDPPHRWADHGIAGPIRALVEVTIEPSGEGGSRLTISVDFEGHGIGKLLVPLLVRRQAERELPANMQRAKQRLEGAA
jgi:uncharacterized protein YndB with AHSA1/START domain